METIIAILFYLGFLVPGNSYTQAQINSILANQQQAISTQNNAMRASNQSGTTNNGILVINDNEKDN